MSKEFDQLRDVPARVSAALRGKGVSVYTLDNGVHVEVTLALPCMCTLAMATASNEELALRSIYRLLNRELKSTDVEILLQEFCLCGDASEYAEGGFVSFETLSDGWVRASVVCLCGRPALTIERATEDEALDALWPSILKGLKEDGSSTVRCIQCRNGDVTSPDGGRAMSHFLIHGSGQMPKYVSPSRGIG